MQTQFTLFRKKGIPINVTVKEVDTFPWFVALTAGLLLLGFITGAVWPNQYAHAVQPALEQLKQLAENTGTSVVHTWGVIFLHNLFAAMMFVVAGLFFGIFPVISMWYNGLLMGYVAVLGASKLNVPAWKLVLFSMLPHGILELPALIWASALGVQAGYVLLRFVVGAMKSTFSSQPATTRGPVRAAMEFRRLAKHGLFVVVLLFLAAGVESGITPKLIQWGLHP